MVFDPLPGTTYYIAVGGDGDFADEFTLDVTALPTPPSLPPTVQPPSPACPFQLASPGSVSYRGTHSGGGAVCLTVSSNFSEVLWFHALDVPGDTCRLRDVVDFINPPVPVLARHFSHVTRTDRLVGAFPTARGASGTYRMSRTNSQIGTCTSPILKWTATTQATPPWAIRAVTPPALRLSGATRQRALLRNAISVHVRCPRKACSVVASTTAAGVRLKTPKRTVRTSPGRTLRIVLSTRARRAIRKTLRSRSAVRTRVTVVAHDAAGNRTTARRTITLKR
ncbi:MAG: hypothetical protein WKF48_12345 [Solirubrobacteraceae bacterium]